MRDESGRDKKGGGVRGVRRGIYLVWCSCVFHKKNLLKFLLIIKFSLNFHQFFINSLLQFQ